MMRINTKMVYTTDRGIEMEVRNMPSTHLVNAIAHHLKQFEALDKIVPALVTPFLEKRKYMLQDTIRILALELGTRDPEMDHEPQKRNHVHGLGDDYDYPYG